MSNKNDLIDVAANTHSFQVGITIKSIECIFKYNEIIVDINKNE